MEGVVGSVYRLFSLSVGTPPFFSKEGRKGWIFLLVFGIMKLCQGYQKT